MVEIVIFVALVVWAGKSYLASVVARRITVRDLQLAAQLDPQDAENHVKLGREFEYSLTDINPDRAIAELERSVELNPFDPQGWLDLASALQLQGKSEDALLSLRWADYLAPRLPGAQWAIGNYFLLHGDTEEAFRHFRVVLAGTSQYDGMIFNTAWKASGDGNQILQQLIPERAATEFNYLDYLVGNKKYPEAEQVWERIASGREPFGAQRAAGYMVTLLAAHQPDKAYQVWAELVRRGLLPSTYEETAQNLVINGDFEVEPLNYGFDWHIAPVAGVYVGRDRTTFHSGAHSLLVEFPGKQNLDYRQIFQFVRVEPGKSYHLTGFMRTEGITTDSGPRLEVRDPYDPRSLEKFSEALTGSTLGWTALSVNFTAPAKTDLVVVGVARLPSQQIDDLIAGKVWLDDVKLVAVSR